MHGRSAEPKSKFRSNSDINAVILTYVCVYTYAHIFMYVYFDLVDGLLKLNSKFFVINH